MQNILQVTNLTKKFNRFVAVDDISFSMERGEILGFLGPNGAGKTTTIQMLLGLLTPTNGNISYFGKNLFKEREEILERINFSSTYANLPWALRVSECLTYTSYLYDIKDRKKNIEEIVESFRLKPLLKKQVKELSEGQNTRVNLAKAFINNPEVILLDEPTASLDPETAQMIRQFIMDYRTKHEVSILFTSHNMPEVEQLCDRVLFIQNGKIIADNTPTKLAQTVNISHLRLFISKDLGKLTKLLDTKEYTYKLNGKKINIDLKEELIPSLLQDLATNSIKYDEISIDKPSLEDYFLSLNSKGR